MHEPLPDDFAQTLAQKLRDDQLVLFAGAGLSKQAKTRDGSDRTMPDWSEFLSAVGKKFGLNASDFRMDPLTVLDTIVRRRDRATLNEAVREVINDGEFEPGAVYTALSVLPWSAICTTNYDSLLDRCLDAKPVVNETDFVEALRQVPSKRSKLFKLHGSLEDPHTLTARDYKNWPTNHKAAHQFVTNLLSSRTFLFVGYSIGDAHWKALLDVMSEILGDEEKWLFALVRNATQDEVEILREVHQINAASLSDTQYCAAFEQIGEALKALDKSLMLKAVNPAQYSYDRTQYGQAVHRTYGYADLSAIYQWGAGFARDDVSLDDIFVEPDLLLPSPVTKGANDASLTDAPKEDVSELERERRRYARQHETEHDRRKVSSGIVSETERLLIIGAPGQGKSTLLRHLLLAATERWLNDPFDAPFPCLIRLSQWAEAGGLPEGRLPRYLATYLPGFAEISQDAAAVWQAGKVLWLLDGIDEIRGQKARELFQEELVRIAAPGTRHRFVVTTRPAGEPRGGLGAEWLRTELPALSGVQVLGVLRKWSSVLERKDTLHLDADDFSARLAHNPGLRQVRGNALLLTMSVLFFKQRKRLPNDRWEFYDGAEQSLRDSWARYRLSDKDAASLPGDYAAIVLESLALDGMCASQVLFSADQVAATVRAVLSERDWTGGEQDREVPRFLDAARDAIGVLVEQAPDRFGFVHLTFQEFLAARALVKRGNDAPDIIARFWDHPDGRETWLLYALGCQLLQGRFPELFNLILDQNQSHSLDLVLRRPERSALRLAGVGSANLPTSAQRALDWAADSLREKPYAANWGALTILLEWERAFPATLHDLLFRQLRVRRTRNRQLAVRVLASHADDATIKSVLINSCKDRSPSVRSAAIDALSPRSDEPEILEIMLKATRDSQWMVRRSAIKGLAARTDNTAVREAILQLAKDRTNDLRHEAIRALAPYAAEPLVLSVLLEATGDHEFAHIGGAAMESLAARADDAAGRAELVAATKDSRLVICYAALVALGKRAELATTREVLVRAAKGDDWYSSGLAVAAFSLGNRIDEVTAFLISATRDRKAAVRATALRAIRSEIRNADVCTVLLGAITDKAVSVRSAAIMGLADYVDTPEVRDALLVTCRDKHESVRLAAIRSLSKYTEYLSIRATFVNSLNDSSAHVRSLIINAMAKHAGDPTVRTVLVEAARMENGWNRFNATINLRDYADDVAVRDLLLLLIAEDALYYSANAIDALASRVEDPSVTSALLKVAKDGNQMAHASALRALAKISDMQSVRDVLVAGVQIKSWEVRMAAVEALALRADAPDVRKAILGVSQDPIWTVREAMARTLAPYAGDETVQATLILGCKDDDEDVRKASMQALEDLVVREKFPRRE